MQINGNEELGKTLGSIITELVGLKAQQQAFIHVITSNMGLSNAKIIELQQLVNKATESNLARIRGEWGI